jgi:hypothetical protein
MLARLQLGLEALYRVETRLAIDAFVIDDQARDRIRPARAPREQLLLREADGELGMALFVDAAALANLERNDPGARLDDRNFTDFCLAVEGVSHFVYVALAAAHQRPVSQLELELQAEVDKFVCCVLLLRDPQRVPGPPRWDSGGKAAYVPTRSAGGYPDLRGRLFGQVSYSEDLDAVERERYRTANQQANRYAAALERRFVTRDETSALLAEVRRFYRMDLPDKLGRIAQLA